VNGFVRGVYSGRGAIISRGLAVNSAAVEGAGDRWRSARALNRVDADARPSLAELLPIVAETSSVMRV